MGTKKMKVIYRHKQYWMSGTGRRLPPHVISLCSEGGKFFLVNAEIDTDKNDEPVYGTFEVSPEQAFSFATECGCLDRRIAAKLMMVPEDTRWVSERRRPAI